MNRVFKRLLLSVGICSVGVISASAFALGAHRATLPPQLQGVSSLAAVPSSGSVVEAATAADIQQEDAVSKGLPDSEHLLSEARALASTYNGHHVYLVPTATGQLCVAVEAVVQWCSDPLSASQPVSYLTVDTGSAGPTAFGVTMDGVRAVDLTVAGKTVRVPARGNWFAYTAGTGVTPDDFTGAAAVLANGTTTPVK